MTLIRKVWEIHRQKHKRLETQTSSFDRFELKAACEFIELIWIKILFYYDLGDVNKKFRVRMKYEVSNVVYLGVLLLETNEQTRKINMGSPFLLLPKDQAWMKMTIFQDPKSKRICKLVFQKPPYFQLHRFCVCLLWERPTLCNQIPNQFPPHNSIFHKSINPLRERFDVPYRIDWEIQLAMFQQLLIGKLVFQQTQLYLQSWR